MNGRARKLIHAAAITGLLSGLAATPALADHHKHWKKHKHGHQSRYYRDDDRPRARYYREYDRHYYDGPRAYYAPPPSVYVHPAPPSFGLSLVFPIH